MAQLRQISRDFAVHMEAVNGAWELRLLPQPLFRYGDESSGVTVGALLGYVWTTGTDPELLLLLECRQTADGLRWHYAPIRFTLRALRLDYKGREIWNSPPHKEPSESSNFLYTTGFVRAFEVPTSASNSPSR